MDFEKSLTSCVAIASVKECVNAPGRFTIQLVLDVDPTEETGARVVEWWNTSKFLEEISTKNT